MSAGRKVTPISCDEKMKVADADNKDEVAMVRVDEDPLGKGNSEPLINEVCIISIHEDLIFMFLLNN